MLTIPVKETIAEIINTNKNLSNFWSNAYGWAPSTAAALMSKSRLDWQFSLSENLKHWIDIVNISDGDLILAWVNLGTLIEGTLKLFLSVHYEDYRNDIYSIKIKKVKLKEPDSLTLGDIIGFFERKNKEYELLDKGTLAYIKSVQYKRNAIHAFEHRDIGNYAEFIEALSQYLELLIDIDSMLPYPD